MKTRSIRIDELHINVPGTLERDEAHQLAREVGWRLVERLSAVGPAQHLGALDLRLPHRSGISRADLADAIAAAVVAGISRGGGRLD